MKWRKLCGWFAGRPRYSSRLNVTTREKSNFSSRCRRTSSWYIRSIVLPVANPRRSAGFLRTALAMTRAASRPSSSEFGFRTSSICPPLRALFCRVYEAAIGLAEPPNEQLVAVRAIKAQDVGNRFALGRVDQLTYAHQGLSPRNGEQFGGSSIGGSGVDLLVSIAEF